MLGQTGDREGRIRALMSGLNDGRSLYLFFFTQVFIFFYICSIWKDFSIRQGHGHCSPVLATPVQKHFLSPRVHLSGPGKTLIGQTLVMCPRGWWESLLGSGRSICHSLWNLLKIWWVLWAFTGKSLSINGSKYFRIVF